VPRPISAAVSSDATNLTMLATWEDVFQNVADPTDPGEGSGLC